MTFEGLGEMFEVNSACVEKFILMFLKGRAEGLAFSDMGLFIEKRF